MVRSSFFNQMNYGSLPDGALMCRRDGISKHGDSCTGETGYYIDFPGENGIMTSRERVFIALDHQEPDRTPIHVDFTPEAAEKMSRHLRLSSVTAEAYSGKVSELPLYLGHDILVAWHGIATSYYAGEEEEYTCEWGVGWRWVDIPGGRYTEIARHPLADERALESWSPPDAARESRYVAAKALLEAHGRTHAIVGGMPCTLFEAAW